MLNFHIILCIIIIFINYCCLGLLLWFCIILDHLGCLLCCLFIKCSGFRIRFGLFWVYRGGFILEVLVWFMWWARPCFTAFNIIIVNWLYLREISSPRSSSSAKPSQHDQIPQNPTNILWIFYDPVQSDFTDYSYCFIELNWWSRMLVI